MVLKSRSYDFMTLVSFMMIIILIIILLQSQNLLDVAIKRLWVGNH